MSLRIENITVTVGADTASPRTLFRDFSLDIADGESVVVVGSNGAGKSTLLNVIAGRLRVTRGTIYVGGQDVTALSCHQRAGMIAQVMQDPNQSTVGRMTLYENMCLARTRGSYRRLSWYHSSSRRTHFMESFQALQPSLTTRMDDLVMHLSGGQRQCVALVMALTASSRLLLLDEISAALDPLSADQVMEFCQRLVTTQQQTTLMITHDMQQALQMQGRTLILNNGRITHEVSAADKQNMTIHDMAALLHI